MKAKYIILSILLLATITKAEENINGAFGYYLGRVGENEKTKCKPEFREFKECEIKVTPKTQKIYLIRSTYLAATELEAKKEFTITVECLKEIYTEPSPKKILSEEPKIRQDFTFILTKNNRQIKCSRYNQKIVLEYTDLNLIKQCLEEEADEKAKNLSIKNEISRSNKQGLFQMVSKGN